MKTLILRALAAGALLVSGYSLAQEKIELKLRVVDSDAETPVPGCQVLVFENVSTPWTVAAEPDGEWTGNSDGELTVQFKAAETNGYSRRIQIHHRDYVSFEKSWWYHPRANPSQVDQFPSEFIVKLQRGVTVGGVVRDAKGKPLEGVRVFPIRHSYSFAETVEWSPAWPFAYTFDGMSNAVHALSDSSGHWQLRRFPMGYSGVAFVFVRPDQSFVSVFTQQDRFNRTSGPVVPLPEFLSGEVEISLPDGHTLKGVVTDELGKPLAGVALNETHGRNPGIVVRTATDAEGRFTLPHRPLKEIVLVARAPGRALVATNIMVEPDLPDIHVVLRPQQGIEAKVIDGQDKPIAGARVAVEQFSPVNPLEWEGTSTDAEGRFRWDAAPLEPTAFYIVPTNGPARKITLQAGEPEKLIVIRAEQAEFIRLTGTVVDAETREPVKQFAVVSSGQDTYAFTFKAGGTDGRIDLKLPLTAWREGHLPVSELQLMADGYMSQSLGQIDFRESDREFHVALKPGASDLAGVVLTPDGKPANGAQIELTRSGSFTFLNRPGEFQPRGRDSERFTTGTDGRYSFPSDQRYRSFTVTHETGFASAWASNLVGAASIQLEPWARITGRAMESDRPVVSEPVSLQSPSGSLMAETFGVGYSTTTDADGRFTFDKVPAGRFILTRRFPPPPSRARSGPIYFSHAQGVSVRAGENKEITYGGNGRTVIGLMQGDPPGLAVDWLWDVNFLTPVQQEIQPTRPNFSDYVRQESYMAALREFQTGNRGDAVKAEMRYQVRFDSDGRFEIPDVPPGKYTLAINLTEPQSDGRMQMFGGGKSIGSVQQAVVVSEGPLNEPVDIGTVQIKITGNVAAAKPLPSFEALTFEGEPLRASDWRGKHVALVFWAGWCRATAEMIPELQQIYSDYRSNPNFKMVGVSLDESADAARDHARDLSLDWAAGWLDDTGRLLLIDSYGVRGTPTLFLLDPNGKIAARDLKPATLRAALDRALKSE